MPLEIKDKDGDKIIFGNKFNLLDFMYVTTEHDDIRITKMEAELIVKHLQEQFNL